MEIKCKILQCKCAKWEDTAFLRSIGSLNKNIWNSTHSQCGLKAATVHTSKLSWTLIMIFSKSRESLYIWHSLGNPSKPLILTFEQQEDTEETTVKEKSGNGFSFAWTAAALKCVEAVFTDVKKSVSTLLLEVIGVKHSRFTFFVFCISEKRWRCHLCFTQDHLYARFTATIN